MMLLLHITIQIKNALFTVYIGFLRLHRGLATNLDLATGQCPVHIQYSIATLDLASKKLRNCLVQMVAEEHLRLLFRK